MLGFAAGWSAPNRISAGYAGAVAELADQRLIAADRAEKLSAWSRAIGAGELDQGELEQLGANGGFLPISPRLAEHVGTAMSERAATTGRDQWLSARGRKLGRLIATGPEGRPATPGSPPRPRQPGALQSRTVFAIWIGPRRPSDLSAAAAERHRPQAGHGVGRGKALGRTSGDRRRRNGWERARVQGGCGLGSWGTVTLGTGTDHVN